MNVCSNILAYVNNNWADSLIFCLTFMCIINYAFKSLRQQKIDLKKNIE